MLKDRSLACVKKAPEMVLLPNSCSMKPMVAPVCILQFAMDFIDRPTMAAKSIGNIVGPCFQSQSAGIKREYGQGSSYVISNCDYRSRLRSVVKQFAMILVGQESKCEGKTGDCYDDKVYAPPKDLHAPRGTQQLRGYIGVLFLPLVRVVQIT